MTTILYVDDELGLLELGKLFLERDGLFTVDTVPSARDALELLKEREFDAIISDYQMPEMDGIAFLKEVRRSGSTVPFLIFTGRGREEIVIQAFNEGADFYIQKGGDPNAQFTELSHKVQKAIFERKAAVTIRDHERREADIINFLPDATFAIDINGIVIAWNRAMEKMTGVAAGQILGKGDYEYALPFYHQRRPILINLVLNDDPVTAAKYPAIKREGRTLFSEIAIPHFNEGNGAVLWFTASPLYDTGGTIVGAIESIREITERKRAETALNESERRFRKMADLLPQVVYESDERGRLVYANNIAFELFGYTEEEMKKGLTILNMIVPEDRSRVSQIIRQMAERKVRLEGNAEYTALKKDGSTFPVSIYSSPVIRDGRVAGFRGIIIDITDRKRAEEEILENERKYRTIFENTGAATIQVEDDLVISKVNTTFEQLTGYRKEEIEGVRKWTEFVHPDDLKKMVEYHRMRREAGGSAPLQYEFRIFVKDGSERVILLSVGLIPGTKKTIASLFDITGQKKTQDELVAANQEYLNLLSQIQDIYYRSDNRGRLTKASRSWATLLGYSDISECIGRSIADDFYANPKDRRAFLEAVYRNGKVTDYEVLLRKKDGNTVLVATSSHLTYDPAGIVTGVEGTFRDITGRKKIEQALVASEQKYRNVIEDQTEFISRFLQDGTHVFVNEAYCRYFGLERDAVLGQRFRPKIPVEDRERVQRFFASLTPENPVGSIEHRIIMPDGSVRWQRWSDRAIFSPSGTIAEYQSVGGDITDTKKQEEAIRQSEEKYRSLSEASDDLIFVIDRNDRVSYVNTSAATMLGIAPQDVAGRTRSSLFPPGVSEGQGEAIRAVFESGKPFRSTGQLVFNNQVLWFDHSLVPVRDAAGTVIMVLGISRDITEQKTVENALRDKSRELDNRNRLITTLLDNVPIGIFMVEAPTGKPLIANQEAARLLGRGILPDATEHNLAEVYEAYKQGTSLRYPTDEMPIVRGMYGESRHIDDMVVVRPDGTKVLLEVFGTPVFGSSGQVLASLVSFMDISERKHSEEELRVVQEKYTKAFLSAPDAITISELDSGKFIEVNEAAITLFGYHRDEMIGKSATELGIWLNEEARAEFIEKLERAGQVLEFEVTERRKSGEIYYAIINADTLTIGSQRYIIAIIRDISDRKRAERTIMETNRKLNLLSSITRHDVANQVTILKGFTQIARMKQPDPVIANLLAKIDNAGTAIARQIAFTKEYQELGVHAPGWYRLSELVRQQKITGISVSCTCDAEIFADPMIGKVFFNLIDNAVRHGERVKAVSVRCAEGPEGLTITVEDDGVGVPLDEKEKIFEKGYGKNTGYGLFLSREILAITGISIHETGRGGNGARFEITVPQGTYRNLNGIITKEDR